MTDYLAATVDRVEKAIEALKTLRPSYTELLDFYRQIFMIQENYRNQIKIDPILIHAKILEVKAKEKLPLISISEFAVDKAAFGDLCIKICEITETANQDMAASAKKLRKAIEAGELNPESLYSHLLKEDDLFFTSVESQLYIEKKVSAFVTYNSLKPSLVHNAQQLASYLDADEPWEQGYCPICGSAPGLSMFENEGERYLFCSFCWHRWFSQRIYCPFCDNKNPNALHYYFSEEEKTYRVDVCDKCRTYIKTVDTRNADRPIYPPLEFVATLHLDFKAQEMGFKSGMALKLSLE